MSDVTEYISRGKSPKYTVHSTLPVINQKSIRWSGIQEEYLKFIDPAQFELWAPERFIRLGDVLWNSTGTGTLGRACLITQGDLDPPKVVDSHVTIVRPNFSVIEPRYLFAWIRSPEVQDNILSLTTGTTNQIELSRAAVANLKIPLAPLNEQMRIADKLDRILAKVDACRERCDRIPLLLKRFRQSVLAAATSGQLTEDWREEQMSNLIEWPYSTTKELCEWITKGTTPSKDRMYERYGDVPYIKVYNLCFDGTLDFSVNPVFIDKETHEVTLKRSKVFPGDVLMNIVGPPLGKVSIVPELYPEWNINQAIALFRVRDRIYNKFLAYVLMSDKTLSDVTNKAKATAGQFNLTLEICREILVPVPSLEEQAEIVRRVETLFAYADRLEAQYQRARVHIDRLTPALLDKAFRGKLVPQDPKDEPASVLLARLQAGRAQGKSPFPRQRNSN